MRSVFVDTNVLIYARDADFPKKAEQATTWLTLLTINEEAVISPQVLNEFVSVSLRRFQSLTRDEVHLRARALIPLCHAPLTVAVTAEAITLHGRHHVSWWDALIVASALAAGCRYLLTEDLQHGMDIGLITVINPFETRPETILRAN